MTSPFSQTDLIELLPALRTAARHVDPSLAEDAALIAWLRLRQLRSHREISNKLAYAKRVARRVAARLARDRERYLLVGLGIGGDESDPAERQLESSDLGQGAARAADVLFSRQELSILRFIRRLTHSDRQILLHAVDGLSQKDIAVATGQSAATVSRRLGAIWRRLVRLHEDGPDDGGGPSKRGRVSRAERQLADKLVALLVTNQRLGSAVSRATFLPLGFALLERSVHLEKLRPQFFLFLSNFQHLGRSGQVDVEKITALAISHLLMSPFSPDDLSSFLPVMRRCAGRVDPTVAEDAVQQAYLILMALPPDRKINNKRTYAQTVVRNEALRLVRKQRRLTALPTGEADEHDEEDVLLSDSGRAAGDIQAHAEGSVIWKALLVFVRGLEPDDRQILAYTLAGLGVPEIARELRCGMSQDAIRRRLKAMSDQLARLSLALSTDGPDDNGGGGTRPRKRGRVSQAERELTTRLAALIASGLRRISASLSSPSLDSFGSIDIITIVGGATPQLLMALIADSDGQSSEGWRPNSEGLHTRANERFISECKAFNVIRVLTRGEVWLLSQHRSETRHDEGLEFTLLKSLLLSLRGLPAFAESVSGQFD